MVSYPSDRSTCSTLHPRPRNSFYFGCSKVLLPSWRPGSKTNFVVAKLYVQFYAAVVLGCVDDRITNITQKCIKLTIPWIYGSSKCLLPHQNPGSKWENMVAFATKIPRISSPASPPDRPVYFDANSTSLERIQTRCNYGAKTIHSLFPPLITHLFELGRHRVNENSQASKWKRRLLESMLPRLRVFRSTTELSDGARKVILKSNSASSLIVTLMVGDCWIK